MWYYYFLQYTKEYYKPACVDGTPNVDECNTIKMQARAQAIKMWIVSNVANFISQMALVVILCSFGKKSESTKDIPVQPVADLQNENSVVKKAEDDDVSESSHLSYTLLDTYKNSASSIN